MVIKAKLKANNIGRLALMPAEITYIGWLLRAKRAVEIESSMLMVEFDNNWLANLAI
jgi:hypothetical protein